MTAEVGSAAGAGLGADLQAATKAAAALTANASSQNRRGALASSGRDSPVKAGLGLSCLIVVGLELSRVGMYFPYRLNLTTFHHVDSFNLLMYRLCHQQLHGLRASCSAHF